VDWEAAQDAGIGLRDLEKTPARGIGFGDLPAPAVNPKNYTEWSRDFASWLYGSQKLELLRSPSTGQVSKLGEMEREFRLRLKQVTRERRDDGADVLRKKYAPKISALEEKIRKAEQAVEREAAQASQAKLQTAASFGSTLLGAFLGRKISAGTIGKASTAIGKAGRSAEQEGDVKRAKQTVETYKQDLAELNEQFKEELDTLAAQSDPNTEDLEIITLRPKKTDISVQLVSLVWVPYRGSEPAW
jgi:hypothetical protein